MIFRGNLQFKVGHLVRGVALCFVLSSFHPTPLSAISSQDGFSYLISPKGKEEKKTPSNSSTPGDAQEYDREESEKRANKDLLELVDRANSNPENAVATVPEERKNGTFDNDDGITSLSTLSFHTNNDAICMTGDGSKCSEWLDKDISEHGAKEGDSSDLEKAIYKMWQGAKKQISNGVYKIWNVAVRAGESLLKPEDGRLNIEGLAKYELNEEADQTAKNLGTASAEKAIKESLGSKNLKDGEVIAPPPELLRALAVNTTRAIVNHSVNKWAGIQASKKGVEVIVSSEANASKYKQQVESQESSSSSPDKRKEQADLNMETLGLSLDERVARAEALRKAPIDMMSPTFEGDQLKNGNPNDQRYDEWAYRATVAQIYEPSNLATQSERPKDFEISERQIASELTVGPDSPEEGGGVKVKTLTARDQINIYNRELEKAARRTEEISAQSPSFVNNASQIRSHKIAEGESILEINDLTSYQKEKTRSSGGAEKAITQNPSPKVDIPVSASELVLTKY